MLREILPVYKRELKSYFVSPAVYVVIGMFLGFVGLNFFYVTQIFLQLSQQKMTAQGMQGMGPINITEIVIRSVFGLINFIMLFAAPVLTMRVFSEERRLGTLELLVTCPLRDWSILLGKYFAALTVGVAILLLCAAYPITIQIASGGQAETPVILVSFLGLLLIVAAYVSFGVFASSLTENQMLSAIVTFVGLLSLFLVGRMDMARGRDLFGVPVASILDGICIFTHSENFTKGVISLTDVVYFVLFSAFFLIIAAKILEARRWRV